MRALFVILTIATFFPFSGPAIADQKPSNVFLDALQVQPTVKHGGVLKEQNPFEIAGMLGEHSPGLLDVERHANSGATYLESGAKHIDATCLQPRPYILTRALVFYLQSDDARKCRDAVISIQGLTRTFGEDVHTEMRDASYLSDPEHSVIRRATEEFVTSCTRPLNDDGFAITKLLGLENSDAIKNRVGLIETDNERCVGTMVGTRVLTARHCFADLSQNATSSPLIKEDAAISFVTMSGRRFHLTFDKSDRSPFDQAHLDRDWISMAVVEPTDTVKGDILFKPSLAILFQPLILVSLNPYVMALRNDYSSNIANATIDLAPACSVMARDGNYVFHKCQTLPGMSGSPLFTIEDGRLALAAIHNGDTEKVQTSCALSVSKFYGNYGVVPSLDSEGVQ